MGYLRKPRAAALLAVGILAVVRGGAQNAPSATTPKFEVASIKPSASTGNVNLRLSPSGVFSTTGTSLINLITLAYGLHEDQITGAPSWAQNDRYDLNAKSDTPGRPSLAQLKV